MAHDVFISYAVGDKPTADAVCATLEARQIRCWIAPRDVLPGEGYAEALVEAIDGSRLMVLVFSSHSNTSPHVMREVERAASRGMPILPLRIEDVNPSKSMAYFISRTHWLDALTPPLRKHLQRLAETVTMLLARGGETAPLAEEATVPAPPADEATSETELARPRLLRRAQEVAKSWSGRPLVRFVLGIGGTAAVVVIVLAVLLFGGGEGDSRDGNPPTAAPPTAVPTPTAAATPTTGLPITGEGPTGSPETIWVSSIPPGGKAYLAPHGTLEAGYPGPPIPDETYFIGTTPLEIEIDPGEYDVAVKIGAAEDREYAVDGFAVTLTVTDAADNIAEQGRIYEIVKEADEQEIVIALFQVADEPYSTLLDSLPDKWLFDFSDEVVSPVLREHGVSEAEMPTVLAILHRGGKIVLKDTDPITIVQMAAVGFSVSQLTVSDGAEPPINEVSDEDRVASRLQEKVKYVNEQDWRSFYELLSPSTRQICSFDDFKRNVIETLNDTRLAYGGDQFAVRDVRVTVSGDSARVGYTASIDGRVVTVYEDDFFVKVDGRWYDVDEEEDGCPDSGEGRAVMVPVVPATLLGIEGRPGSADLPGTRIQARG